DIGTGSGASALALKRKMPDALLSALDVSEEALETARHNAAQNQVSVNFISDNILKPANDQLLQQKFDIIVSNPPYIHPREKAEMHQNVLDFEPCKALFVPGDDALIFYRSI